MCSFVVYCGLQHHDAIESLRSNLQTEVARLSEELENQQRDFQDQLEQEQNRGLLQILIDLYLFFSLLLSIFFFVIMYHDVHVTFLPI
jgi:hypothetical protein